MKFEKGLEISESISKSENDLKYDVDKKIDQHKEIGNNVHEYYNPDNRVECYNTTEKERIDKTPKENSERGTWEGERGKSMFIPNLKNEIGKTVSEELARYGAKGIEFKKGIPDFSKCSIENVKISNMTDNRYNTGGNFEQADTKCAQQWNEAKKDGKTDWTPRDIEQYRHDNHLSWHECSDMTTCMLVPQNIHHFYGHTGGVCEYNKGLNKHEEGVDFDE